MPGKSVRLPSRRATASKKARLDAIKMEHTIAAPMDGVVTELLYAPGDQVVEGAELLRLGDAAV